jgi:hypothetical protein
VRWRKGDRADSWYAELPGEDRIRVYLPPDTPAHKRRVPTAFDMNVLFLVLAEAQAAGTQRIELPSFAAVLRDLGLAAHTDNRRQLKSAFDLWRELIIRYRCWYALRPLSRAAKDDERKRVLPPPIEQIKYPGNRAVVTVAEKWVKLVRDRGYKQLVPLPLPLSAAEQNAALLILTSAGKRNDWCPTEYSFERGQSSFARKCGLVVSHRRRRLVAVLDATARWFEEAGGYLEAFPLGAVPKGQIRFAYQMPRPRWRRSKHTRKVA